jgi:hypothetical protein
MAMALVLPAPSTAERNRLLSVEALRRQALERLYRRRNAVDDLIRSLEGYQMAAQSPRAEVVPFTVARKCSSGSVQSRI